jgi:hypothetical protein
MSLYMPTFRSNPDKEQNVIQFKNLIKELEHSLRQTYSQNEVTRYLNPFYRLLNNRRFWQFPLDGLVMLATPNHVRLHRIQQTVPAVAVVGQQFYLKPLLRLLQSADRYQVLGVSRDKVCLYQGNRYHLDEVELDRHVPATIEQALGDEVSEARLTVASYGGTNAGSAMYHGHGGHKDSVDNDTRRFFTQVDRAILAYHSRPSNIPLLLGALPEHQSLFREVSHNPWLLKERLNAYPGSLENGTLKEQCWELIRPYYTNRLDGIVEEFKLAQIKNRGSVDLEYVAEMAEIGRIKTMLVDADRQIPGVYQNGKIRVEETSNSAMNDLLDDLSEVVIKNSGEVVVVPGDMMPSDTGLAAIFRY